MAMLLISEDLQDPKKLKENNWILLARGGVDAKHSFKVFSSGRINDNGLPDTLTIVLSLCDIFSKE